MRGVRLPQKVYACDRLLGATQIDYGGEPTRSLIASGIRKRIRKGLLRRTEMRMNGRRIHPAMAMFAGGTIVLGLLSRSMNPAANVWVAGALCAWALVLLSPV